MRDVAFEDSRALHSQSKNTLDIYDFIALATKNLYDCFCDCWTTVVNYTYSVKPEVLTGA